MQGARSLLKAAQSAHRTVLWAQMNQMVGAPVEGGVAVAEDSESQDKDETHSNLRGTTSVHMSQLAQSENTAPSHHAPYRSTSSEKNLLAQEAHPVAYRR